jgi:hypothetical protein
LFLALSWTCSAQDRTVDAGCRTLLNRYRLEPRVVCCVIVPGQARPLYLQAGDARRIRR